MTPGFWKAAVLVAVLSSVAGHRKVKRFQGTLLCGMAGAPLHEGPHVSKYPCANKNRSADSGWVFVCCFCLFVGRGKDRVGGVYHVSLEQGKGPF